MPQNNLNSGKLHYIFPDIFTIWQQNKYWILLIALLFTIMIVGVASLLPPKYKASAQIYVDPRDLQTLGKQVTPGLKSNIGTTLVETQALILKSDNLLRKVIAKARLVDDPEFNGTSQNPVKIALSWLMPAEKNDNINPDSIPLAKLKKAIDVHRIDRSYVLQASIKTWNRQKSQKILKALVDSFLNYQTVSRTNVTKRLKNELSTGTQDLRSNVESLEQKIENYKEKYNLSGIRGQIISERQLSDINAQLVRTRVSNARLKARLDSLPRKASEIDKLPEALSSQTIRALRISLATAANQKARYALRYFPGHPTMRAAMEKERDIKKQIRKEISRIRGGIAIEYKRSKKNEILLASQLKNLKKRFNKANKAQIGLRELERKLAVSQKAYQSTISRITEANGLARINTANIQVISAPHATLNRIFPPSRLLLSVIGFLLGLVIAFVLLHLRYHTLFAARQSAEISRFPADYPDQKSYLKRINS